MTTRRENMLKVYRHEEPEWTPIVTIADNYNHPIHMPPSFYAGRATVDISITPAFSRYFDVEIMDRTWAYKEKYRTIPYTSVTEGDYRRQRWETPYGVITSTHQRVRFSSGAAGDADLETWFPVEYPVKGIDSFRAFAHIFDDLEYEFHPENVAQRAQEVGDDGIVTVGAPSSPLGMSVRFYMGVQTLGYLYADYPTQLRDLLEHIGNKNYEAYRGIAQTAADATINYDDTTTRAISPTMFRDLEVPFLNATSDIMHTTNKFCIHHACGHVKDLLALFRTTRLDGFDGPAPLPEGDTTVAMARAGMGTDIAINVGAECPVILSGEPALIRAHVRSMFEQAGSRKGFILDVAPPPAVPVENLWLVVDEAKRWARQI